MALALSTVRGAAALASGVKTRARAPTRVVIPVLRSAHIDHYQTTESPVFTLGQGAANELQTLTALTHQIETVLNDFSGGTGHDGQLGYLDTQGLAHHLDSLALLSDQMASAYDEMKRDAESRSSEMDALRQSVPRLDLKGLRKAMRSQKVATRRAERTRR